MLMSLSPALLKVVNSSRVVIKATPGAITISASPMDCVFCGAVAEHTFYGRGVCLACRADAKRIIRTGRVAARKSSAKRP